MSVASVSLNILAIVLFIVWAAIWSFHFFALAYGKYKFHKKTKRVLEVDKLPGVSIIKPLMGIDDNLKENLETFFTLEYPLYELLFCVQDNVDPVISLVQGLIEKYPTVDAKLFTGGTNVGINPKINNMQQGYEVAKYELFMVSDAGLKMAEDTLYDMVSLMTEKVGLVHQMPFTTDRPGFAGTLEKVYFGTQHCRMYLFINLIGINCVTGMSCLMRKCVIDKVGGLKAFSNYIAEDYFIAQAFLDNNWVIQLSHQPAMQNSANYSVPMWKKRMIRWCKLRLKMTVPAWLEPMQECLLLGLTTSWTVNYLFNWNSLVFFMSHVLLWFIMDYFLLSLTQNGRLPFSKFHFLVAWLYRESICFYLFLKAAWDPTVKWRNGRYRLRWGGYAEEIIDKNKEIEMSEKNLGNVESAPQVITATTSSTTNIASKKSLTNLASFNSTFINSKSTTFNQSHKRTNSHSLNSTSFNNNISRPSLTNLHGSNSDLHKIPSQSSLSATTAVRSHHHHHHHSISTHPTLLHTSNSTAALIDLSGNGSKSSDLKII